MLRRSISGCKELHIYTRAGVDPFQVVKNYISIQGRIQNKSPEGEVGVGSNFCPQNCRITIPFQIQADVSRLYCIRILT